MFKFQFKRSTASDWAFKNPILLEGEPGVELETNRFKLGDGQTRWLDLDYFTPGNGGSGEFPADVVTIEQLNAHIAALEPHVAYDDGPSFTLLYENAKV